MRCRVAGEMGAAHGHAADLRRGVGEEVQICQGGGARAAVAWDRVERLFKSYTGMAGL